jgi:uncharacterized membrane protein
MKAFGKLAPAQAIGAMQSINVVITPWFLTAFFGGSVVCCRG